MTNEPLSDAELAELERLYAAATQGEWWDDTYNSVFVGKGDEYKIIFSIPDHPKGDSYEPDQSAERGAWYKESAQNKDHLLALHNAFPRLLATIRQERERCASIALEICGEYPADYNLQRTGAWISASHKIEMAIRSGKAAPVAVPQSLAGYVSLVSLERERCAKIAEFDDACTCPCHSEQSRCYECCDGGTDSRKYIAAKIRSGK